METEAAIQLARFIGAGLAAIGAARSLGAIVRAFEQAIVHEPSLAAAHNGLGAALVAMGDSARARAALERAAELAPQDPNPLLNLALLHERGGDARLAREAWSAALVRDPEHPVALHLR